MCVDKASLRKDLSREIAGSMKPVSDEELKAYELVIAQEDMAKNARMIFGNLLGSISTYPNMVEKHKCKKHVMENLKTLTAGYHVPGVQAIGEGPRLFGYIVHREDQRFVCFVAYGDVGH